MNLTIKRGLLLLSSAMLIALSVSSLMYANSYQTKHDPNKPSPTSLVTFSDDQAKNDFLNNNGLDESDLEPTDGLDKTYVVPVPNNVLKADEGAKVAPRREYRAVLVPNDPIYPQWYTTNIAAPTAWDTTTGSNTIAVAVVDTGFGLAHEDMANRWTINAGEFGGGKDTNGLDDDSNGRIDDWRGWDFLNDDNNPNAGTNDPTGDAVNHGTITAGLIGATGNNATGVASVNWGSTILPLQMLSDNGVGFTEDLTAAINYAVARGAKVISLSLGSTGADPTVEAAINSAVSSGVTVIAAAGNCGDPASYFINGCDYASQMLYPARYSNVVAVGAVNQSDNRASFSSYGPELDLVAPGSGTIQAPSWSQGNQTSLYTNSANGTSFATPIVSGSVALLYAQQSGITPSEVLTTLISTADKTSLMSGAARTDQYGYGRLNVYGANRFVSVTHPNGTLVINRATGEVYLIENSQKRYIGDPATFLSYYRDVLAQTKTATPRDLDLLDGSNLTFHSGTVVKGSGLALYVVADIGGTLYKQYIPSPDVHNALGFSEAERVPVSDSFLSSLPDGTPLSTASQHANGSLVIAPDKQTVYLISNNQKHHVPNPYVLQSLNKGKYFIKPATGADMALETGVAVAYEEGALLKGSAPSIYITHLNGEVIEKQHITSPFIYSLLGYQPNEWINVPVAGLPATTGASIN